MPKIVGLFVAAGRGGRTERRAVENHLVQFGVGAQRLEFVVHFGRLVLATLRFVQFVGLPMWLAENVIALRLQLAGQQQQRRHRRQEDARGLPGPPGPDEPADGLSEEQRG